MPNQEKDDKASSSPSSGGYSAYGGEDSPGERGGRGTTGSSSNTSTSSSKGSSSSSSSYSGTVGSPNDKTSYGDSRMGTGRDSSSIGGRDSSNSDSGYSGYGGDDSPSERGGRGTSGSQSSVQSTNVADRFDSGSGGLGQAYRDMAASATQAGISNLAGDSYSRAPSFRESEISGMAKLDAYQNALGTIRSAEANRSNPYTSVSYASPYGKPDKPDLTDMTIGQVLNWMEETDGSRGKSYKADRTYVGSYQIGKSTLQEAVNRTGISLDAKFSKPTQDYLAMDLIDNRAKQVGAKTGEVDPDKLANRMAMEWAGLSMPNGRSFYDGTAGNKANVSRQQTLDAATGLVQAGIYSDRAGLPRDPAIDQAAKVAANAYRDPSVTVRTPDYNPQPAKESAGQRAINQIAAPSPDRFRSTYLATPETGPTPQAKPQQELTTGQKIMAGAIDIGSGFIPGVGTGLGIVNAGLQLTGNQTIGERIVRGASAGTAPLEDQAGRSTADNGAAEMQAKAAEAVTATPAATAAATPTVERFVSNYLRPTPREKWSRA